jgi:hypothetical protein
MKKISRSTWITIGGVLLAGFNAWLNVDWGTFQLDRAHVMPLVLSTGIAVIGHYIKSPERQVRSKKEVTNENTTI